EIIIIDDGSKDNTLEIAKSMEEQHPISVISKPNGGKWSALNSGIGQAKGEIVVCIDADTILKRNAIELLIRHFNEDKIAAVAGNVKVGNRNKFLTKFQAFEYISGLNIQRRSEAYFQKITVVPGPLGAFRKSILEKIGYYTGDTFAEDADLTLKILKAGYKITYEPRSIGYTEAPSTLLDVAKQRYRWYRGLLQAMNKHKNMIFNPKYGSTGFFMIPWMFFNGIIFSWFSFFTILWLFCLMFNPISGFVIYQPNPTLTDLNQSLAASQSSFEAIITINYVLAIPLIYIAWFFIFLILEIVVGIYAVLVDIEEKPQLILNIIGYNLFYAYVIDTIRILSQLEQYFNYPMKWERTLRMGL
ncbi:MAG: glycosyltransferase family 2 protein, partial [Candidatus Kariarchaeaceae archaeon]